MYPCATQSFLCTPSHQIKNTINTADINNSCILENPDAAGLSCPVLWEPRGMAGSSNLDGDAVMSSAVRKRVVTDW